jgi:CheY-like chemotaxis protein
MKILIAEDDSNLAEAYRDALENRNHEIVMTANGEECLNKYRNEMQYMQDSIQIANGKKRKEFQSKVHRGGWVNVPFDAVILDYKMPKKDGLQVAKEIFELNPRQRIIFASAYVQDTLVDSVKHLNRVVELMQKPFGLQELVDTVEDKEAYEALNKLIVNIRNIKDLNPTKDEAKNLFENLRRIQRYRY